MKMAPPIHGQFRLVQLPTRAYEGGVNDRIRSFFAEALSEEV